MIIRWRDTAIKFQRDAYITGDYDDDEIIRNEKDNLRRLKDCDGIVRCLDLSGQGIHMVFMENGNLRDYLQNHRASKSQQLSWFRDLAQHLAKIHDRRVVIADISLRNLLLTRDLTIKFSDMTEGSRLSPDCDIETADDKGYSIYTDIGQLGAVMYEVIKGERCDFDLFRGQPPGPATARWPRREHLPVTENVWLGWIIDNCWTRGAFRTCHDLSAALESASTPSEEGTTVQLP